LWDRRSVFDQLKCLRKPLQFATRKLKKIRTWYTLHIPVFYRTFIFRLHIIICIVFNNVQRVLQTDSYFRSACTWPNVATFYRPVAPSRIPHVDRFGCVDGPLLVTIYHIIGCKVCGVFRVLLSFAISHQTY